MLQQELKDQKDLMVGLVTCISTSCDLYRLLKVTLISSLWQIGSLDGPNRIDTETKARVFAMDWMARYGVREQIATDR